MERERKQIFLVIILVTIGFGLYFGFTKNEQETSAAKSVSAVDNIIESKDVSLANDYVYDYLSQHALVYEKITSIVPEGDPQSDTDAYAQGVEMLTNLHRASEGIRVAMITLQNYKDVDHGLVKAHAEATMAAYASLRASYIRSISAQEKFLKDSSDEGMTDFFIELSSISAEIDSTLKVFPNLTMMLAPFISSDESEQKAIKYIDQYFDTNASSKIQAGQHAFFAGAVGLRQILTNQI